MIKTKILLTVVMFGILVAGLALTYWLSQRPQTLTTRASVDTKADLFFAATKTTLIPDETVNIGVLINAKALKVSAASLVVKYPSDRFEAVSFSAPAGSYFSKDFSPDTQEMLNVSQVSFEGSAGLILGVPCPKQVANPPLEASPCLIKNGGSGIVGTLTLRVKPDAPSGNAEVSFDTGAGKTAVAAIDQSGSVLGDSPPISLVINSSTVPTPTPNPAQAGFYAQYFDNKDLSGEPKLVRQDSQIKFDWRKGAPADGLPKNKFSARWRGFPEFAGGTYRFSARADDGVRLIIDGKMVIDQWKDQGATRYDAFVLLSDGIHSVIMEYYENGGRAVAELSWNMLNSSLPTLTPTSAPIFNSPPEIQNQSLPNGRKNTPYKVQLIIVDSDPGDSVRVLANNLPPGLTLICNQLSSCRIEGTPSKKGTFDTQIQATDSRGSSSSRKYNVRIVGPRAPIPILQPIFNLF